jgi:hypothetical protein
MADIIDLVQRRAPAWGATVTITPWPLQEANATLTAFWGHDGKETAERCRMYADALDRLAGSLRETANTIDAVPSGPATAE